MRVFYNFHSHRAKYVDGDPLCATYYVQDARPKHATYAEFDAPMRALQKKDFGYIMTQQHHSPCCSIIVSHAVCTSKLTEDYSITPRNTKLTGGNLRKG